MNTAGEEPVIEPARDSLAPEVADPQARRLVLVRHGQTAWNLQGRAQGHLDIHLDETGQAQAAAIAPVVAALHPDRLFSSDLARAADTAAVIAAACGLQPVLDARFREYAVGENRAGRTLSEYAAAFPEEYAWFMAGEIDRIPGRESAEQVRVRWRSGLSEVVAATAPGELSVVVGHGAALKTALVDFLGWQEDAANSLVAIRNCALVELEESASTWLGGDAQWRLVSYNRTS